MPCFGSQMLNKFGTPENCFLKKFSFSRRLRCLKIIRIYKVGFVWCTIISISHKDLFKMLYHGTAMRMKTGGARSVSCKYD